MALQRIGNREFKTLQGTVAPSQIAGFSHVLIDDASEAYGIDLGRRAAGFDELIGTRIEAKGLVSTRPLPIIHLLQFSKLSA